MSEPRLCTACGVARCATDRRFCNSCRHKGVAPKGQRPRRRDYERDREPYKGKHCHTCEGMAWRRPLEGRCKCGEVYGPDPELAAMRPRFWRTEAA